MPRLLLPATSEEVWRQNGSKVFLVTPTDVIDSPFLPEKLVKATNEQSVKAPNGLTVSLTKAFRVETDSVSGGAGSICKSKKPCHANRCGCKKVRIKCSSKFHGGNP